MRNQDGALAASAAARARRSLRTCLTAGTLLERGRGVPLAAPGAQGRSSALLLASGRLVHAYRRRGFAALADWSGRAAPVHLVLKPVHAASADPRAGHAAPRLSPALNPCSDASRLELSLPLVDASLRQIALALIDSSLRALQTLLPGVPVLPCHRVLLRPTTTASREIITNKRKRRRTRRCGAGALPGALRSGDREDVH